MNQLLVLLCFLAATFACSKSDGGDERSSETATAAPTTEATPDTKVEPSPAKTVPSAVPALAEIDGEATAEQGLAAATAGAKALGATLKGRLMGAMQEGGLDGALEACASEAQELTSKISTSRLRVGRSTLRLRNPKNGEAPMWVKAWLAKTGERKAEGVLGVREVVHGTARVLIPLAVGEICLACHGDPSIQPESTKAFLKSRYPDDAATGYELGDLRGAVWAEFDLSPSP